jgi:hypothetical protein
MTGSVNDRAGDKLCMKMNLAGPVLLMKRERNEPALLASCDSVEVKAIMDAEFMKNPVQSNHKKEFLQGKQYWQYKSNFHRGNSWAYQFSI